MADHPASEPYKSTLPELSLPPGGFKSELPDFLLPTDPNMKWLMEEVSKNTQATEFACKAAVLHNEHLRVLNGRTAKNEKVAADAKEEIAALKDQAGVLAPVSTALSSFASLWQYKTFKAVFLLGMVVVCGVAYPFYLQYQWPILKAAISALIGI